MAIPAFLWSVRSHHQLLLCSKLEVASRCTHQRGIYVVRLVTFEFLIGRWFGDSPITCLLRRLLEPLYWFPNFWLTAVLGMNATSRILSLAQTTMALSFFRCKPYFVVALLSVSRWKRCFGMLETGSTLHLLRRGSSYGEILPTYQLRPIDIEHMQLIEQLPECSLINIRNKIFVAE